MERKERDHQEAMRIKDQQLVAATLQLEQEKEKKKARKREKKMFEKIHQLLENKKEEKKEKDYQEAQRLINAKEELQMKIGFDLKQLEILQARDELKEKERRRRQSDDDEHQKQRTNNEIMRRMGLVNVGKVEHDLDIQRKLKFVVVVVEEVVVVVSSK